MINVDEYGCSIFTKISAQAQTQIEDQMVIRWKSESL